MFDRMQKQNFKKLLILQGGESKFLDVNSADGANLLTDMVTMQILKNIGEKSGKGEDLVNIYKKSYLSF